MVDLIWFNSGYELPTFSWKAWGSDVYMKISWNGGTPKIIQVMDDWMTTLVLKTMVTWGSPHFEKTPKRCSSLRAKRKQPRASAQACRLFDAPCQLYQAERPNLPLKKGVYPNTWPWKTLKNWGNWCFNPMELGVPFFSNKPSCFFPFVWQKSMVSCRIVPRSIHGLSTRRWFWAARVCSQLQQGRLWIIMQWRRHLG